MPTRRIRSSVVFAVCCAVLQPTGSLTAASPAKSIETRLVGVGLAIERQIEIARHNEERGTLDRATLERHAAAAAAALETLEGRIRSLPGGASHELLVKLHAIQTRAENLARAAELGSAPPSHPADSVRVRDLERRAGKSKRTPSNDDCADAFPVGPGAYTGDTTEATNDGEASCGASLTSPDVWYRFAPMETGWVIAETTVASFDTVLSVHSSCPGTMTNQIECGDDGVGLLSSARFLAFVGNEYLVRVSGSNGAVGTFTLSIGTGAVIEGIVTDFGSAPVSGVLVGVYDADGYGVRFDSTDGAGAYSIDGLVGGGYFVATDDSGEMVNELYDDHPCPGGPGYGCDVTTGDEVVVTSGSITSGIDFELDRSGVVTGTVTDESSGLGIDDARVLFYDTDGDFVGGEFADGAGVFWHGGLPPGEYFVWANSSTNVPELYHDVVCVGGPPDGCDFADGTAVSAETNVVTSGVDFELQPWGAIMGTVVDRSTGLPIGYADVVVYDTDGDVFRSGDAENDGSFEIGGLPDGTYFVKAGRWNDYVNQLYDGMDCPAEGCDVTTGTPIVVTALATVGGIDFDLIRKGAISGVVRDENSGLPITGVDVTAFDAHGSVVGSDSTDAAGGFLVEQLHAGTHFVGTTDEMFINELYDDLPFGPGSTPTDGTPVLVSNANTTSGIDFTIIAKGSISGSVTAETGGAPIRMRIELYDDQGMLVDSDTSYDGEYEFSGVDDGQYFVLADRHTSSYPYLEELYDDIPCWGGPPEGCMVTDGAPVTVTAATVTAGIDFALLRKGSVTGVVTEAGTGLPVEDWGVVIWELSGDGTWSAWDSLEGDGSYGFDQLIPGQYAVAVNAARHRDEVWDDMPCQAEYPDGCDLAAATPITVLPELDVEHIDFTVERLGTIGGMVRSAATGAPLSSIAVSVFDEGGEETGGDWTDFSGSYEVDGLWPGSYTAATSSAGFEFVDQLFDGIDCPLGPFAGCDPTTGTPLAVGFSTASRWVDFNLESTGSIAGRVTDADTGFPLDDVRVGVWDAGGVRRRAVDTDVNGNYLLSGLEAGSFFVATEEFGYSPPPYIDLLFDGIPCPGGPPTGCDPAIGTPVSVAGGETTVAVDFALTPRTTGISGTVVDAATGMPIEGVQIDIWGTWGDYELGVRTGQDGTYVASLHPNTYVVATDNSGLWANQVFDGIPCTGGSAYNGDCDPLSGDVVTVVSGELTESIDFALGASPAIFADGFESGTTGDWSATVP